MKILFCQFSTKFLYKGMIQDIASKYYNMIYIKRKKAGYYKNDHFWEVPLWIAEACYILKRFNKKLYIIQDIKQAINYINNYPAEYILFSVLDINKNYVYKIIRSCRNKKFIIGGYINFTAFKKLDNCIILDNMQGLAGYFNSKYTYGTNYKLFKNYKIIPRLVLSTGCTNRCKFCTIEKTILEKTKNEIIAQIKSFKHLKFKLVYINDKTFFQAKNYYLLDHAYHEIKKYNKAFKGFIIQSTVHEINKRSIKDIKKLHIKIIELGIESFNNKLLALLHKPQNEKMILACMDKLKNSGIKIIGNFIIGILQENKKTYTNTLKFIRQYIKNFYILNIYNLAIYNNCDLAKDIKTKDKNSNNELSIYKDYYSIQDKQNIKYFNDNIFKLGIKILNNK